MTIKTIFRWLTYLLLAFLVIIVLLALFIRFYLFPNIDEYKSDIANFASNTLQRKLTIGEIKTGWHHLSPTMSLHHIQIYDEQNRSALTLKKIDTELSWLSLGLLDLKLSKLTAYAPELIIRRTQDNVFFIAGINLSGRGNPDFANWILSQSSVNIQDANIVYYDEYRKAPPISLKHLNASLSNSAWKSLLGRHEFKLSAMPSIGSSVPIELDGHFIGRDIDNMNHWYGDIHTKLDNNDIAVWKPWIDYPINIQSGAGKSEIWLHFADANINKIQANVQLNNASFISAQQSEPLIAQSLNGVLGWSNIKNVQAITFKDLHLQLNTGVKIEKASGQIEISRRQNKPWLESKLSIQQLDLEAVTKTLPYFNLPSTVLAHLKGISPQGALSDVEVILSGSDEQLDAYKVSTKFHRLTAQPYLKLPGFTNLTGIVKANQDHGLLELNTEKAVINLKDILRWPVQLAKLEGKVNWDIAKNKTLIEVQNVYLSNSHITGNVNANYEINPTTGDTINLKGSFGKGNAKYALFYYPTTLTKDTLHWLDTSILAGKVEDVALTIQGKVADFPYVNQKNQLDPKKGLFRVSANISDALIDYGTGWPMIQGMSTKLLFEGNRMELNANKGQISGNKILKSKIEIPQLDADWPMLHIVSDLEGPVKDGIRFVNESPVKEVALGFTDTLKAAGNAHLNLELHIPLQDLESAKYKGAYQIKNGTLFANEEIGLPELSKLNGTLNFTEQGLSTNKISTDFLGSPAQFSLTTDKAKRIRILADGQIKESAIKKLLAHPVSNQIQGSTHWNSEIVINKPFADIKITSDLIGLAIQLPAPFNKPAQLSIPLLIEKKQTVATEDHIYATYGNLISAKLVRNGTNGDLKLHHGDIGINTIANPSTDKGITVHAKFEQINADEWLEVLNAPTGNSASQAPSSIPFSYADLSVKNLTIFDRQIQDLRSSIKSQRNGFNVTLMSKEIEGVVDWETNENGKITAKLNNLIIPNASVTTKTSAKKDYKRLSKEYPSLDIQATNFEIDNKKLGMLALNAFDSGDDWVIQNLKISNPDTTLIADGTWHNWTRNPNTNLKFELITDNIGRTLKRFGQADAVKGGKASITGKLQWPGSPHEFDASGLNGNFKLEAEKGQILKVQPGVGRLLGLLTLQSLPRRLTLDFRDLFSDGFAFDKINATAVASQGVLRSNDFFMTGPAAEAKIKGETNLKTETQNLKIKVIPHVSDSLSLAALAGGPIAGAAAFVAQKILKDPFNKIASTEYIITGTWDNPQEVESKKGAKTIEETSSPLTQ